MERLERQKKDAKAAYMLAVKEWRETITPGNIKGDFEKWKIVCQKQMECMHLGVII